MLVLDCLDCLGLLKMIAKSGNDSVEKTTKDDDEDVIILGYNFLGLNFLGNSKNQLSMIDVKSRRVSKVSGVEAAKSGHDEMTVGNSCNGLIQLIPCTVHACVTRRNCVIFNPKSNEIVKRVTKPVWFHGNPVGFFYHPLAKEYRTLHVVTIGKDRYEYHIYQFGSNTWRPALNPCFHLSLLDQRATCTKQALYWRCKTNVKKIVVFDIINEELCLKSYPVCCMEKDLHTPTLVAKNEDSLCCCYGHRAELSIDVWVLEDYANWSWNRKYVVNLNLWKADRYPSESWSRNAGYVMGQVIVISIQKDELVLCYKGDPTRSIYSYHLVSGFSVTTQLSNTDWNIFFGKESTHDDWYKSKYCGFVGL